MIDHSDLVDRARRVRAALAAREAAGEPPERPLIVEFAGTPKSGKSTCIDGVAHFFRRLEFRVNAPTEGASKRTPTFLKDDLTAFNTWSACYALSELLEAIWHPYKWHLAILDRGLFDSLVWFDLLTGDGVIPEDTRLTVQGFLMIELWRGKTDLVVLFTVEPAVALERENKGKLIKHEGRAMNPEFLARLNEAYERVADEYGDRFERFVRIDTSVHEEEEVDAGDDAPRATPEEHEVARVVDYILGIMEDDLGITS